MKRVRVSTTVDGDRLERARSLAARPDAELFDRALALFVEAVEGERERAALRARPYDADPDLALPAPGPEAYAALPYDGDVPADVQRLAADRRRRR
jgi:hypothetical protein